MKKETVTIAVDVPEMWIKFVTKLDTIFQRNHCGDWMELMSTDAAIGFLVFEHGDEVKPPEKIPARVFNAWENGEKLPPRWHHIDLDLCKRAFAAGVKHWGVQWTTDRGADATRYDVAIQTALFGEVKYG